MITFKIKGSKHQLPTTWSDFTYSQYIYHLVPRTFSETLSLLTGIPKENLDKAEIKGVEKIALALSFMNTVPDFQRTKMVGPYTLPQDVTIQSLGQFEDLRGLLKRLPTKKVPEFTIEDHRTLSDLYLEACAIYVQKLKDGAYDYNKVGETKELLKSYSCTEVMGTGGFFLFKQLNSSTSTKTSFQNIIQRLKKKIQDLPGYRKTLDSLLR